MNYRGYTVLPKYVKDGAIEWKDTGNGLIIVAEKGGKKYRIKKNKKLIKAVHVSPEGTPVTEATYKRNLVDHMYYEHKQPRLRQLMGDLSFDKDHIIKEEENFWDDTDNRYVSVMRYVDVILDPMTTKFEKESNATLIDLFKKMATQMAKLHDHGIIHGDLKTENFLYCKNGSGIDSYIQDFDISYPADEVPKLTEREFPHTDGWESPEIQLYMMDYEKKYDKELEEQDDNPSFKISDDEKNKFRALITPATDVYTLGLIFHKLMVGYQPLPENDKHYVAIALLSKEEITIAKKLNFAIGPKVKAAMSSLVSWMIQMDFRNRPTMHQVLDVLNDNLEIPEAFRYKGSGEPKAKFSGLFSLDAPYAALDLEVIKKDYDYLLQTPGATKDEKAARVYIIKRKDWKEEKNYTIRDLIVDKLVTPKEKANELFTEDNLVLVPYDHLHYMGIAWITKNEKLLKFGSRRYDIQKYVGGKDEKKDAKYLVDNFIAYKKGTACPPAPWERKPDKWGKPGEAPDVEEKAPEAPVTSGSPKPFAPSSSVSGISICAPRPGDNIRFVTEKIKADGFIKVEIDDRNYPGEYIFIKVAEDGKHTYKCNPEKLLGLGYAVRITGSSPEPSPSTNFCTTWPEDKIAFDEAAITAKGYRKVERDTTPGMYSLITVTNAVRKYSAATMVALKLAVKVAAPVKTSEPEGPKPSAFTGISICTPRPEDKIRFVPEKIKADGYIKVEINEKAYPGGYVFIKGDTGKMSGCKKEGLLELGYAVSTK